MTFTNEQREDLYKYLKANYTGPDKGWPQRWWEPGAEDAPKDAPKDQWLSDDEELPFE